MSLKGVKLPAYNPALGVAEKEKVIQESLRMINNAFMATGTRVVGRRTLTQETSFSSTALKVIGDLTISFTTSGGMLDVLVRIPATLGGGASLFMAALSLDGSEYDRQESSGGLMVLGWRGVLNGGEHVLQVSGVVNAGTVQLASSTRWAVVVVTETLL